MPIKPEIEEEVKVDLLEEEETSTGTPAELVVYNDDYNTFDWVIECFEDILGHSSTQAEQLALLIHFKGKAIVKSGHKEDLKPKKDALVDKGLSAVIETV